MFWAARAWTIKVPKVLGALLKLLPCQPPWCNWVRPVRAASLLVLAGTLDPAATQAARGFSWPELRRAWHFFGCQWSTEGDGGPGLVPRCFWHGSTAVPCNFSPTPSPGCFLMFAAARRTRGLSCTPAGTLLSPVAVRALLVPGMPACHCLWCLRTPPFFLSFSLCTPQLLS